MANMLELSSDAPRAALSMAELPSHIATVTAARESAVACSAGIRCVDSRPLRAARWMDVQPDCASQMAIVVPSAPVPPMTRQLRKLRWPAAAGNRLQPGAHHRMNASAGSTFLSQVPSHDEFGA